MLILGKIAFSIRYYGSKVIILSLFLDLHHIVQWTVTADSSFLSLFYPLEERTNFRAGIECQFPNNRERTVVSLINYRTENALITTIGELLILCCFGSHKQNGTFFLDTYRVAATKANRSNEIVERAIFWPCFWEGFRIRATLGVVVSRE